MFRATECDGNEGTQCWLQGNTSVLTSVLGQALSPLMRDVRPSQAAASWAEVWHNLFYLIMSGDKFKPQWAEKGLLSTTDNLIPQ